MSDSQHSIIPEAGWYQDPEGGHRQRFWTGVTWSDESRVSRGRKKKDGPNRFFGFLKTAAVWAVAAAFLLAAVLFGIHMMEQGKKDDAAKLHTKASSVVLDHAEHLLASRAARYPATQSLVIAQTTVSSVDRVVALTYSAA